MENKITFDLSEMLFNGLNQQGFLFQEKCADDINNTSNSTRWRLHTTEHPVSLKDHDTRIDIIIREIEISGELLKFGVIECKKVNPDYNCWLFGKPLYEIPGPAKAQIIKLSFTNMNNLKVAKVRHPFIINSYVIDNWWIQVNIDPNKKNNQKYSDPEPIEDALIQVCFGVGGLVEERIRQITKIFNDQANDFYNLSEAYFIPIIVTTAELYVSKYNLSDVDISTGTIEKSKLNFEGLSNTTRPVNWVMVEFGAPNRTIPDLIFNNVEGIDPVDMEPYNRTSVFIVNSRYLEEFLRQIHSFRTS